MKYKTKSTVERIKKTRNCFFEKTNKIDIFLVRLTLKKNERKKAKIVNTRNEKGTLPQMLLR